MLDWFPILFCSFVAAFVAFLITDETTKLIPHFENQFFERDPALSHYDKNGEQVPGNLLNYLTLPTSFGMVFVYAILSPKSRKIGDSNVPCVKRQPSQTYVKAFCMLVLFVLALAAAILSASATTHILKSVVGRPRPSAFYECNYKGYADAVNTGNFTMYNAQTTANAEGDVINCLGSYVDAWSSFPSGHTSQSFSTLTFTTLVMRQLFQIRDGVYLSFLNLIAFAPLVVAAWISITRITDYKHHVDDVLAGAIIGAVCAGLAFSTAEAILEGWSEETMVHRDALDDSEGKEKESSMV